MEWLRVGATEPDEPALARAAEVLRSGGVVIFPTDTLYGLAADPRHAGAIERVFAVKGRDSAQALPLIASSREQAEDAGSFSERTRRLSERFWPGPLTLVASARTPLARGVAGEDGTVAIRVPDHAVARGLAAHLGFPVTSTSANRSGGQPWRTAEDAARDVNGEVDLVLDAGPTAGGAPSTIVDARADPPRLLRAGAVPFDLVLEALTHP